MPRFLRSLLLLLTLGFAAVAYAQPAPKTHIRAELVAQTSAPRAGGVVNLAIVFTPDPGWHGYWQNPGDAGLGAQFDWRLPAGITAGAPLYPVPERLVIAGLMNHVFEHRYALIVQMKLPRGIAPGTTLPIRADAKWLACTNEICVPERGTLAIDLKAGDGTITPEAQAEFDGYWAKLPRPLGSEARFQRDGKTLRIGIPFPAGADLKDPWFYASTEEAVAYAQPQRISRDGDMLIVETGATGGAELLEGVLAIRPGQGVAIRAEPGTVASRSTPVAPSATGDVTVFTALLAAILGGLILNVMPCVFPIISLKALSLVRAGESATTARSDALAYTAGVVTTCVALGGLLLALRAGGEAIGWAFQLQSPAILFLLLLLGTAITLNLLGVFELRGFGGGQALTERNGAAGSFWTGALAAFVATPCSGPFMAAALGAALVLPALAALAIFAGLGLGLALPFLALGFIPALRNRLPKPGGWMNGFRRILALPMALTTAALLWLLWRQGGLVAFGSAAVSVTILAALLWRYGRSQQSGASGPVLAVLGGLALIGFGAQAWALQQSVPLTAPTAEGAERFDLARLERLRRDGKPVFLYFTADWCLTCKVNEKAAIEREEVVDAFDKAGITVMVGDWTNGDPTITRFLESRGRSGVPLYLFYKARGEPVELPQVLTPATLLQLSA